MPDTVKSGLVIVSEDVLPEIISKVLAAKRIRASGEASSSAEACRIAGISRSAYYKYKDKVLEPSQLTVGRKASLMLTLNHQAGMLSKVLAAVSAYRANILTITQSLPIRGKASIMLSVDLSQLTEPMDALTESLDAIEGVENVRLLALE